MENKLLESLAALKAALMRLREEVEAFDRARVVAREVEEWRVDVGTDIDMLLALRRAAQRRVSDARTRVESSYMGAQRGYVGVAEMAARLQLDPEARVEASVDAFIEASELVHKAHKVFLGCRVHEDTTTCGVEYDDGDDEDVCQF